MGTIANCAALLLLTTSLAGCAGSGDNSIAFTDDRGVTNQPYPANYRVELLAFLKTYLNDPTGIKNAAISQPALKNVGVGERYVVCVRFNAKNPNGAYAGVRDQMAIFLAGKLDQMGVTRDLCKDAVYEPFPELERLTR